MKKEENNDFNAINLDNDVLTIEFTNLKDWKKQYDDMEDKTEEQRKEKQDFARKVLDAKGPEGSKEKNLIIINDLYNILNCNTSFTKNIEGNLLGQLYKFINKSNKPVVKIIISGEVNYGAPISYSSINAELLENIVSLLNEKCKYLIIEDIVCEAVQLGHPIVKTSQQINRGGFDCRSIMDTIQDSLFNTYTSVKHIFFGTTYYFQGNSDFPGIINVHKKPIDNKTQKFKREQIFYIYDQGYSKNSSTSIQLVEGMLLDEPEYCKKCKKVVDKLYKEQISLLEQEEKQQQEKARKETYKDIIKNVIEGENLTEDQKINYKIDNKYLVKSLKGYNKENNNIIQRQGWWDKALSFGENNAKKRRINQLAKIMNNEFTKNMTQEDKAQFKKEDKNTRQMKDITIDNLLDISNMRSGGCCSAPATK